MSRGPGRLQRRILDVLAALPPGEAARTREVAYRLGDEWQVSDEWWLRGTFERQCRRALDRLHVLGRVEKRIHPHQPVAWWSLSAATRETWAATPLAPAAQSSAVTDDAKAFGLSS